MFHGKRRRDDGRLAGRDQVDQNSRSYRDFDDNLNAGNKQTPSLEASSPVIRRIRP